MPTAPLISDKLLDPISEAQPAGEDLRWAPEWDRIKEARRSDDGLAEGKWAKKDRKVASWPLVAELATSFLSERSKDLQLVLWLTEANVKLHGFAGLRDGLRLTRELINRYWDAGLYPLMEEGAADRAGPLEFLNEKMTDCIGEIPITARMNGSDNYSYINLLDARIVGSEANCKTPDGEIDRERKKKYDAAVAAGAISKDMFDRAVKESRRAEYEELNADFTAAFAEFLALDKVVDERYGAAAPKLSDFKAALQAIRQELDPIMEEKRKAEPDPPPAQQPPAATGEQAAAAAVAQPALIRMPVQAPFVSGAMSAAARSWEEAEALIRSGQVDQGLAQMTQLAAGETCGRDRFRRKLLLAEVCLASNRDKLARSILEQLAEQIEKHQLEVWESSELVSTVWTRLYQLYKTRDADAERAKNLYERLCRLDPWQALNCQES